MELNLVVFNQKIMNGNDILNAYLGSNITLGSISKNLELAEKHCYDTFTNQRCHICNLKGRR